MNINGTKWITEVDHLNAIADKDKEIAELREQVELDRFSIQRLMEAKDLANAKIAVMSEALKAWKEFPHEIIPHCDDCSRHSNKCVKLNEQALTNLPAAAKELLDSNERMRKACKQYNCVVAPI